MTEHEMYDAVAIYLQLHYPRVIYRFDIAADLKLSIYQAKKFKQLHPRRGYPDLFIACPNEKWHGLYLEIKKDGNSPYKKDGKLKTDQHIQEQAQMMCKLIGAGYKATFTVGLDETLKTIDKYMRSEI